MSLKLTEDQWRRLKADDPLFPADAVIIVKYENMSEPKVRKQVRKMYDGPAIEEQRKRKLKAMKDAKKRRDDVDRRKKEWERLETLKQANQAYRRSNGK